MWMDIKGYEGLYQVSNYGRIKSLRGWNGKRHVKREKIINGWQQYSNKKYEYKRNVVSLLKDGRRKEFKVHQLVAKAFVPNPNGFSVVNHKDFNPLNNYSENLEWTSFQENIAYSRINGRFLRIPKTEYKNIMKMYELGDSTIKISNIYGVSHTTILRILKKCGVNSSRSYSKYNIDLNELLHDLKSGNSNQQLAKKYNCSLDIIATRKHQFKEMGIL